MPRLWERLRYQSAMFSGGCSCSDWGFLTSVMESVGQAAMHAPHPMHRSGSTEYLPESSVMASIGHLSSEHTPHDAQVS